MIRQLLALLVVLAGLSSLNAQQKEGRWTLFPSVGDSFSEVIETPDKTYLLSGTSLFSFSDDDNESYAYNVFNKLTERDAISKIAYNKDKRYLFVAYSNGNIDLLYDNGKTVNLPDIKDASLTVSRGILDVDFGHDRIFVATEFGLVVFDDERHLVIESGIYNVPVNRVFSMGDHLVLQIGRQQLFASRYDDRHLELSKMRQCIDVWHGTMAKLNDNTIVANNNTLSDTKLYKVVFDFGAQTETRSAFTTLDSRTGLQAFDNGLFAVDNNRIALIDKEYNVSYATLPSEYAGADAFLNSLSSVWVNTPAGITRLNLAGSTPSVLMQPYKPEALTTTRPYKMSYTADGSKLYASNLSYSFLFDVGLSDNPTYPDNANHYIARTCVIENGAVRDVQPASFNPPATVHPKYFEIQEQDNTPLMTGGTTALAVDPDDPDMYYITNCVAGIFVIKDGELIQTIDSNNCPYNQNREKYDLIMLVDIDNDGNLWITQGLDNEKASPYVLILPAAKRKDIRNIKKTDWIPLVLRSDFITRRDMFTTFCRKSPVNIINQGGWEPILVFQAHNNTPLQTSDDRLAYFKTFTDQNGNTLSPRHISCAKEDHDGKIWVGMHTGTFVIDNPADCFGGQINVRRPIVARNDGTGLGDYLLETQVVYDIAIDAANRKWYATNSGAYLVSADGTEIIAHYDTDNSPLPSNTVASVECDPTGNRVYFGTDNGLACYDSDAAPAADDYSEVYAYPNPVRPDYTGWITIAGLMDNSLVKIADSAGNVFYQGSSEGGMVSWDGCDPAGRRVKSGVYFVFASQNNDGSSKGAVAKILVIN